MNGDSRMEVDEEDGAETEGEMETRYGMPVPSCLLFHEPVTVICEDVQ